MDYALTPLGRIRRDIVRALVTWAEEHIPGARDGQSPHQGVEESVSASSYRLFQSLKPPSPLATERFEDRSETFDRPDRDRVDHQLHVGDALGGKGAERLGEIL